MKARKLFFVLLALVPGMVLGSCGSGTDSSSVKASSESSAVTSSASSVTPVSSSSYVAKKILSAPVLALNAAKDGLTWAAVPNAVKYQLKVNDGAYADATAYTFSTEVGTYAVKVKSIGDGETYTDSGEASWTYKVAAPTVSKLNVSGLDVSWTAQGAKVYLAHSTTGVFADADWTETSASSYTATESCLVGVAADVGYDEANNIYYAGTKAESDAFAVRQATAPVTILGVDSDVADDVKVQQYASTGWVDATNGSISVVKPDIFDDKAVQFHFQNLSNAYDYGITTAKAYDAFKSIGFYAKGDGTSAMAIQLKGLAGYAQYSLGVISTNWTYFNIPFDDASWTVNGEAKTLADFATSAGFATAGDSLFGFSSVHFVFKTIADSSYAITNCYLKEATLNLEAAKSAVSYDAMVSSYTASNASGTVFSLKKTDTGAKLSTLNLETNLSVDVAVSHENGVFTFATADNGASLTLSLTASQNGRVLTYKEASGTYASYVNGLVFNGVYTLDDFDSYTETGVGLDGNHTDASARTGLRANYYGEYYTGSGSGTSALGDKNWQMMGSTDYLNLVTTGGHSGNNCMTLKRGGNTMRFVNYGLVSGDGIALPKADRLSFWAKGTSSDVTLKFTMFTVTKASVFSNDYVFSIAANSDWTQYNLTLDASKTYYGLGIVVIGGSSTVYQPIDDLEMYTEGNPYAVYTDSSVVPNGTVINGSNAYCAVSATFGKQSTISVTATPTGGSAINMTGTYEIDGSNNITIDCGADLKYVGVISKDYTAIKYTSATGTYATAVDGLFLKATVAGKTVIEDFENTTAAALASKYTVDRDLANSGTWTNPTDNTAFVGVEESNQDAGFTSGKFAMDTTSAKVGKYRYRFGNTTSFGSFSNFSIRIKNASSLPLVAYLYVCTAAGSATRVSTSVYASMTAGQDYTTYTGTISAAKDIYGYSLFFTATPSTTDVVTGSIYVDSVLAW